MREVVYVRIYGFSSLCSILRSEHMFQNIFKVFRFSQWSFVPPSENFRQTVLFTIWIWPFLCWKYDSLLGKYNGGELLKWVLICLIQTLYDTSYWYNKFEVCLGWCMRVCLLLSHSETTVQIRIKFFCRFRPSHHFLCIKLSIAYYVKIS